MDLNEVLFFYDENDAKGFDVKRFKDGERRKIKIKGKWYVFCWIPDGKFKMGSPDEECELGTHDRENRPPESTSITDGFWMLETPVTQILWKSIMGNNPSSFSHEGKYKNDVKRELTDEFPVENVSWYDCQNFIKELNSQKKILQLLNNGYLVFQLRQNGSMLVAPEPKPPLTLENH